jgi:transcriptional regulator with XRE-family HTH domain
MTKNVSTASRNIRHLRRKYQFTQEEMAKKLGIKRSLLGAYEEDRANPRLDVLVKAAEIFNVSVDRLVSEPLGDTAPPVAPAKPKAEKRPRETPSFFRKSDDSRQEAGDEAQGSAASPVAVQSLRLVPANEFGSYFYNAVDDDYLRELPELRLPLLPDTDQPYRAFEVADDSMAPISRGSVVVARGLRHIQQIKDGQLYVLVTRSEGVLFRRVFNRIESDGSLLLEAGNQRQRFSVMGREVEAWEVVLYLSNDFPQAVGKPDADDAMTLSRLTQVVLELQQEVKKLKQQ